MRVLVVRAGALGDLLLLRPVIASLRAAGAEVTLLAPDRPGSALVGSGPEDAQRLVSWDGPAVPKLMAGEAPDGFGEYDVALCYSRSEELAQALATSCRRVVRGQVCDMRSTGPYTPSNRPDPHVSGVLSLPLDDLGIPRVEPAPFRPSAEEEAFARGWRERLPSGFVAVHPGSGAPRKNWPFERFVTVAQMLSAGRPWLLSLGPADADATAAGAIVTRDLPPRLLGAVLAQAGAYIGNDSGVSHLAAAWGAPTVALFGPTDAAVWSPRGPRVRVLSAPDGVMDSIHVDDVVECCRRWPRP